jgi:hypothetical protein
VPLLILGVAYERPRQAKEGINILDSFTFAPEEQDVYSLRPGEE